MSHMATCVWVYGRRSAPNIVKKTSTNYFTAVNEIKIIFGGVLVEIPSSLTYTDRVTSYTTIMELERIGDPIAATHSYTPHMSIKNTALTSHCQLMCSTITPRNTASLGIAKRARPYGTRYSNQGARGGLPRELTGIFFMII